MDRRVEIVGWHTIVIELVNKDANCSIEVLTPDAARIIGRLADPDVVALSWTFGSQEYLVQTAQITRVIVEQMEPSHLDDNADRRELIESATPTTRSVQIRTREQEDWGHGARYWHLLWDTSEAAP